MTEIRTTAYVHSGLEQKWLQHLRDFDSANPGCHFKVNVASPEATMEDVIDMLTIAPGLEVVEILSRDDIETMRDGLQQIIQWSEAYPLDIFPEPDLKEARRLLEAGGITLDAVSAHCMRHVISQVAVIARRALKRS
jgi:hypothetical protein